MGETDANLGTAIQAYNESQIAGLLLKPFGNSTNIYTYKPIIKTFKGRRIIQDQEGNLIQDPETGAYAFIDAAIEVDYLADMEVNETTLPIKNFFELGTTSAFLSYGDKILTRDILKAASTQVKILTLEINEYVQRGRNENKINEIIGNINELYFLYGGIVDTSKGYLGIGAQTAKTKIEHSLTDIMSSQLLKEEKGKRFDPLSAIRNRRNKQHGEMGSGQRRGGMYG